MNLRLQPVGHDDLPGLFRMQQDPESNRLAAVRPRSLEAFNEHWQRCLADPTITACTIVLDEVCVGLISCFAKDGEAAVGYWIDRAFWGRGIASRALALLLEIVTIRPLRAWVAEGNMASIRVLAKNGFRRTGQADSPGDDRYLPCVEVAFELAPPPEEPRRPQELPIQPGT